MGLQLTQYGLLSHLVFHSPNPFRPTLSCHASLNCDQTATANRAVGNAIVSFVLFELADFTGSIIGYVVSMRF